MTGRVCLDGGAVMAAVQMTEDTVRSERLDAIVYTMATAFEGVVIGNSIGVPDAGPVREAYAEAHSQALRSAAEVLRRCRARPRRSLWRPGQREEALQQFASGPLNTSLPAVGGKLCLSGAWAKKTLGAQAVEVQIATQAIRTATSSGPTTIMRLLTAMGWLELARSVAFRLDDEPLATAMYLESSDAFFEIETECPRVPRRRRRPKPGDNPRRTKPKKDRRKLLSRLLRGT